MGYFRALKPLQAPGLGLVRPDMGEASQFHWDGNIIGWSVEPLDDDAKRMVEERAKVLKDRGIKDVEEEKPLPTQPFPKGVMKATAGMTAPGVMSGAFGVDTPAPDTSAPNMSASPPRRRKAG